MFSRMTPPRILLLAAALIIVPPAPPAHAQGYSLNGAGLGTNTVNMTIPKTGNTQSVLNLRLQYSGKGANCTTGSLNDYWSPSGQRAPAGVVMGYTSSGFGLPGNPSRGIAINVYSTAQPMSRQWTIVVPKGSCQGSNQTATIAVTLVKEK
jgi:hypothetical protein